MAHFILRNEESIASQQNLVNTCNDENDDDFLKNASKGRTVTDIWFLIFHAVCIGFLAVLLIYCNATGDIDRIIKGYDHCGNVCGKKNDFKIQGSSSCTSMDMTDKPYLSISGNDSYKECTKTCTDGVLILDRCIKNGLSLRDVENSFLNCISGGLHLYFSEIIIIYFLTVALALVALLLLRYFTAAFVWCSIVGAILLMATLTGFSWYLVRFADGFILLAVFMLIATIVIVILVICIRNRIELIIQLFKESAKSMTFMPLLLFEPIMTFIILANTLVAWIYFILLIESAATPVDFVGYVVFVPNTFIKFVRFYNSFIMLWMVLFVYGCQNMLIAGAVSRWYFIRDKKMLVNPILNSRITMLKYHLGTISMASLIVTLLHLIKMLWAAIRRRIRSCSYVFCLCLCFDSLDLVINSITSVINYFTLNVYVVSAIYGSTFYRSGTKAFALLINNTKNVIAINSTGDFVLFLTKLLITVIPIGVGYLMLKDKNHANPVVPLCFIASFAIIIAQCFVKVFEMVITTIFICFCEDCEINDGVLRPYYMSQNLMDFVEKSKDVFKLENTI